MKKNSEGKPKRTKLHSDFNSLFNKISEKNTHINYEERPISKIDERSKSKLVPKKITLHRWVQNSQLQCMH